jgi:Rad52/22 family double-strand break repair protein
VTTADRSDAAALSTYQRLAAPFALADHARVNKGGMDQTYAPWTAYVDRLNEVLGCDKWSSRCVREGFTATECWVLVELTAVVDGETVTRQQYGSEPLVKGKDARPTTDLLKSTASDALKKAASLLGVGLYLSVKEERLAIEEAMREAVREEAARMRAGSGDAGSAAAPSGPQPTPMRPARPQPAPAEPLAPGDRAGLEHRYESLRQEALALGFQASWKDKGSDAWNDLQLPKFVGLLEQFLTRARGAA